MNAATYSAEINDMVVNHIREIATAAGAETYSGIAELVAGEAFRVDVAQTWGGYRDTPRTGAAAAMSRKTRKAVYDYIKACDRLDVDPVAEITSALN